jgi:hypothetical protein
VGGTSGLHDGPLIGGAQCTTEAERRLDEPWFEGDPCGLAVGIEFPRHSQWLKCRCDAPGRHNRPDDDADSGLARALTLPSFLDHSQGRAGCGAITFKSAFAEVQQERLGRRDTALDTAFADGHGSKGEILAASK